MRFYHCLTFHLLHKYNQQLVKYQLHFNPVSSSAKMLTPTGRRGLELLLTCGTTLCLYPFNYNGIDHRLKKATRKQWATFLIHKYSSFFITIFAGSRLIIAWTAEGEFPIGYKVLNVVFFLAYVLTSITMYQFSVKEEAIRQYFNFLLQHLLQKDGPSKPDNLAEHTIMVKPLQTEENLNPASNTDIHDPPRLSRYLLMGLFLLVTNPTTHVKLVQESPCAPNFLISASLPCAGFGPDHPMNLPVLNSLPWMVPEYYITTLVFSSWSFNWVAIFMGISWMVGRLKGIM